MNMKENQSTAFHDSKSFGKEADALAFERKEACQINGSRRTNDLIAIEVNSEGKVWKINSVDDPLNNCESGSLDSSRKFSETKGEEKLQCSPATELSDVNKKIESSNCGSPEMTTSGLFERHPDRFIDKSVLECESPELTVRDKEVNFHVVKDICIDEGMPTKDKILVVSSEDHKPGAEGDANTVFVISNGLEAASLGNTRSVGETECRKVGVSYDELLAQCRSKSPSGNLSDDGSCENCEMEGNKAVKQRDEIFLGEEGCKIPEPAVEAGSEAEAKEDIEPNTVLFNNKIEGGSITFNLNSPEHVVSNITNEETENLKELLTESGHVHAHRDGNADNISDSLVAQCASVKDNATVDAQEQAVDVKNEDFDRPSEAILVQHVSSKDVKNEMACDGQVIEQHSVKHERRNSDEASVISQLRHDEGESSSTAAGLITFSGPIAYSGNLSLRSDGSAASGRSFAFPILQSEWNSSPVRMTKANRRHFRKHKGWRSGLLCCRF